MMGKYEFDGFASYYCEMEDEGVMVICDEDGKRVDSRSLREMLASATGNDHLGNDERQTKERALEYDVSASDGRHYEGYVIRLHAPMYRVKISIQAEPVGECVVYETIARPRAALDEALDRR